MARSIILMGGPSLLRHSHGVYIVTAPYRSTAPVTDKRATIGSGILRFIPFLGMAVEAAYIGTFCQLFLLIIATTHVKARFSS